MAHALYDSPEHNDAPPTTAAHMHNDCSSEYSRTKVS